MSVQAELQLQSHAAISFRNHVDARLKLGAIARHLAQRLELLADQSHVVSKRSAGLAHGLPPVNDTLGELQPFESLHGADRRRASSERQWGVNSGESLWLAH